MTLLDVLEKVRAELPGCELTSVVSRGSGLSLASSSSAAPHDAAAADAFQGELFRVVAVALDEAGLKKPVDDIVVQGQVRTLVSAPLGSTDFFWHVVTRASTTLGFTQAVMRKYHKDVLDAVTALV